MITHAHNNEYIIRVLVSVSNTHTINEYIIRVLVSVSNTLPPLTTGHVVNLQNLFRLVEREPSEPS